MSWLVKSLANLAIPDGDDDDDDDRGVESQRDRQRDDTRSSSSPPPPSAGSSSAPASGEDGGEEEGSGSRGVKEDISELTKTLTRQFWGVASFLAPPPPSSPSAADAGESSSPFDRALRSSDRSDPAVPNESDYTEIVESPRFAGIRGDFAEIGGRFRTGISRLSNHKAVSEITKIASTFLPFGLDGDEEEEEEEEKYGSGGAIGVTEEVLAFARNISMHPETWLDFPLLPEDEDSDDFDMSDAQQEHALAVERFAPRLAALRIELCPSHMGEGCFWKIYFVLLHPRLSKHDAELLSTPQIVEARAMLLQDLQNRNKAAPDSDLSGRGSSHGNEDTLSGTEVTTSSIYASIPLKTNSLEESTTDIVTEKHPVVTTEIKIVDKSVIEEQLQFQSKDIPANATKVSVQSYEDDGDGWLEEETTEMGDSRTMSIPLVDDEDVSFSDLEEDDEKTTTNSTEAIKTSPSQGKDLRDWTQLRKSAGDSAEDNNSRPETKESNEWLNLEDIDVI